MTTGIANFSVRANGDAWDPYANSGICCPPPSLTPPLN